MECMASLSHASVTFINRPSIPNEARKSNLLGRLRAKVNDECDPSLQAAIKAASLRFQETNRPEPLFLDPYAGCFATTHSDTDTDQCSVGYFLATKFIDDKLLNTVNQIDVPKQVVLLTHGMDTRPYRLNWPTSTMIFDVSPDGIFNSATEKLEGVRAKVPRGCLFCHVSLESPTVYNGVCELKALMAICLVSGLYSFEEMLVIISSLATKGCFFLGELPARLVKPGMDIQRLSVSQRMEKLFTSNGFRVNMISIEEVARSFGKSLGPVNYENVLFVAEQLRFSDDQMETWRREFQRIEEDADEEGFEEL